MGISPPALFRSIVQRALGTPNQDNPNVDVSPRLWTYGEMTTQPMVRKTHNLVDEGSYYVASNGATGIVPTYGTSQVVTSPFITIWNSAASGGKNLYLDFIALTVAAALVQTTAVGYKAMAAVLDVGNRYSSGGTALTPNNANLGAGSSSGAVVNVGAIVATAASASARTMAGLRALRPSISATVGSVVGDTHVINPGGVEADMGTLSITASVPVNTTMPIPPIVIPPGDTFLFYVWYPILTAPSAETLVTDIGLWAR